MNGGLTANAFVIRFRFHGDLSFFLTSRVVELGVIEKSLREKTSIKDAIESCGVPHPEVDLILAKGAPVGFSHQLLTDQEIDVFPVPAPPELFAASRLQQRGLKRFVADGHLGKLTRNLRLLGFDVVYDSEATDEALLVVMAQEERALLTRDRRLLMNAVVRHGYCPRSDDPNEQIIEVIRRFDLAELVAPYTRCLQCNGLLQRVEKAEVFDELEPLTKMYYDEFRRCTECRKIYWPGSHFGKLQARLAKISKRVSIP
jgi:uncharacterized protein with PIN domain